MKGPLYVISYCFLIFCSLPGCTTDSYSPGLLGNIEGRVLTFDQYGNQKADRAEVIVSTKGIGKPYEATTDEHGVFRLRNVINGTYTLRLEKQGYASMELPGIQHLGGKPTILPLNCFLYEIPDYTGLTIEVTDNTLHAEVSFDDAEASSSLYLHVFYSSQKGFDPQSAESVNDYYLVYNDGFFRANGRFDDPHSNFRAHLNPGQTIYFRAAIFTKVYGGVDIYLDPANGQTVYPNLSSISDEHAFVLQP